MCCRQHISICTCNFHECTPICFTRASHFLVDRT
nr:MAG TPA: hypothetical protein [Caudoviricetes sp.]DAH36692.1 MAG TPA: hypothetical protein [Caudoviricetes sp.]